MKEIKVEDHLRKRVTECGGMCEKHVSPGRRGPPDDLVTWPKGDMDLVETKCPDGKRKPWQTLDHEKRALLGVPVYLLDTKEKVDVYVQARLTGVHLPALWSVPIATLFMARYEWRDCFALGDDGAELVGCE